MNYPTPTKIAGSNPADPPYPPRPYFPTLGTTLHNSAGAIRRENCWGAIYTPHSPFIRFSLGRLRELRKPDQGACHSTRRPDEKT